MNRSLTDWFAKVFFAPTPLAAHNPAHEGATNQVTLIIITVSDALHDAIQLINEIDDEIIQLKQPINFT
jgi:UDP-N-acetylglucosamine 2-epimerase